MQDEFFMSADTLYLNHAAVSPWPRRTVDAVKRFAEQNGIYGARYYPEWMEKESELRQQLRWLINAPSIDDIALQKNTSEALSTIAMGIEWNPGENVVSYQFEFPSNRAIWQSLSRYGVESRLVDFDACADPEAALFEACDENTRLISVSSVQYHTGLRMDLQRISEFCRNNHILLCVDAIQSLGALPFDCSDIDPDFVVADGHKWMLGPEGLALLYVKAEHREKLRLHQIGWHMLANGHDFDSMDITPAATGKRFECGSPNMLGIHALSASLSLLQEIGMDQVSQQVLNNSEHMLDRIAATEELELISDSTPNRRSGIVTFGIRSGDNQRIYKALMGEGVVCAQRGGGIRFSPHFYSSRETIDNAFDKTLDLL